MSKATLEGWDLGPVVQEIEGTSEKKLMFKQGTESTVTCRMSLIPVPRALPKMKRSVPPLPGPLSGSIREIYGAKVFAIRTTRSVLFSLYFFFVFSRTT